IAEFAKEPYELDLKVRWQDMPSTRKAVAFLEYNRAISGQRGPKNRPEGERSRHPDGFECRENSGSSAFIHQITARTHGRRGQLSRDRHNSAGQDSVPEDSHVDGRFWNR